MSSASATAASATSTARDRRARPPVRLRGAMALAILGLAVAGTVAGAVPPGGRPPGGGPDGPYAVGHDLTLDGSDQQVMQPEHLTAEVATVAVVPGSRGEAWAAGARHQPDPGGGGAPLGHTVMLHHLPGASGWEAPQPLLGAPYAPFNRPDPVTGEFPAASPTIASIGLLPGGEGWAVSLAGFGPAAFYHHDPGGGPWRWWDPGDHPGAPLPGNGLISLSLWSERGQVTGEAVGPGGELVHLSGGVWQTEATPDARVAFTSVSAAGPEEAWAVGRRSPVFDAGAGADPATAEAELARYLAGNGGSRPLLYHRTAAGWSLVTVPPVGLPAVTASPALNQPAPSLALGVAATAGEVWIVGATATQSSAPDAAGAAGGGPLLSNRTTEPYAARMGTADGSWRSYCASSGSTVSCDEPFPSGDGLLSDAALVCCEDGRTELFAGGLTNGFYRAVTSTAGATSWSSLPATVQPVTAIALSSPREGYVASNGNALGTGIAGVFSFSEPLIGHWTTAPAVPSMRRWPQLNTEPYAAVAADPTGSGRAMAVGRGGRIALVDQGGWHALASPTGANLNSITWPRADEAWAVGDRGTILHYSGGRWSPDPRSGLLAGSSLRGIAMPGATPAGPAPRSTPSPPPPPGTGPPPPAASGILAWGRDDRCQLASPPGCGPYSTPPPPSSVQNPAALPSCSAAPNLQRVTALSAAGPHTLAIIDGDVWEWGQLTYQPSPGPPNCAHGPIRVDLGAAGGQVAAIAAGAGYSLAVAGGVLYSWGSNSSGVLGTGDPTPTDQPLPVPVHMPAGAGPVTALAAGLTHALAVAGGGRVYTWGQDPAVPEEPAVTGQVPGGRVTSIHPVPQQVPSLTGAVSVAAGDSVSVAVIAGGEVDTWGTNCSGELGYQAPRAPTDPCARMPAPRPVPSFAADPASDPVAEVSAGSDFVLARTRHGLLYGWGGNEAHQLQQGSQATLPPTAIQGLPAVDQVATGDNHAVARFGNRVYAWGNNDYSELGYPSSCDQPACGLPAACVAPTAPPSCGVPQVVAGLTGSVVAAGASFSEAVGSYQAPGAGAGSGAGGGSTSAAAPPADGYAVGDSGTILAHDGAGWRVHPASGSITSRSLTAVTATGLDFVAAGEAGTLLSSDGSVWFPALRRPGLDDQLRVGGTAPRLLTLASFPDGAVYAGGDGGTLLERPGGGGRGFDVSRLPGLEGAIRSLSFRRGPDGRLSGLASVGGSDPAQGYGWVMALDGSPPRWRDIELGWVHSVAPDVRTNPDTAVLRDAAAAAVLDPGGGASGWAVGGSPNLGDATGASDLENHNGRPTSSVWRVDLAAPPGDPPGVITGAPLPAPPPGSVSFAFLGNTGCLGGHCDTLLGAGSHGDSVAVEALRAILAARSDGAIAFAVSGGDLRSRGDAASLRPFARLFDSLDLPLFAALGARDLQTDAGGGTGTGAPWKTAFAGGPGPWGAAPAPPGFEVVTVPAAPRQAGQAATHYAFDYAPAGTPLMRLVVLDTSASPLSSRTAEQNPPEDQTSWLAAVLRDAAVRGIPPVVVMNRPVMPPAAAHGMEDGGVTAVLASGGVAGVLASEPTMNQLWRSGVATQGSGSYPIGVFGAGGGAPVAFPSGRGGGGYHSWQLVTVGPGGMTVRSIPVLESLALDVSATSVGVGDHLSATGLGRLVDAGTSAFTGGARPIQDLVSTVPFPYPLPCGADHPGGGGRAGCRPPEVAPPDYHFLSEAGHLAPVREDPDHPGRPLLVEGRAIADETSGLLCGISPGSDAIDLISGGVGARLPVTVTAAGSSACGSLPPAPPAVPPAAPPSQARMSPPSLSAPHPHPGPPAARPPAAVPSTTLPVRLPAPPPPSVPVHRHHVIAHSVGVPAVPALVEVIPAPPGGISTVPGQVPEEMSVPEREDEEEAATAESESHFSRAHGLARARPTWQLAAAEVAAAALGAWLLAGTAARRRRPARAERAVHAPPPRTDTRG